MVVGSCRSVRLGGWLTWRAYHGDPEAEGRTRSPRLSRPGRRSIQVGSVLIRENGPQGEGCPGLSRGMGRPVRADLASSSPEWLSGLRESTAGPQDLPSAGGFDVRRLRRVIVDVVVSIHHAWMSFESGPIIPGIRIAVRSATVRPRHTGKGELRFRSPRHLEGWIQREGSTRCAEESGKRRDKSQSRSHDHSPLFERNGDPLGPCSCRSQRVSPFDRQPSSGARRALLSPVSVYVVDRWRRCVCQI